MIADTAVIRIRRIDCADVNGVALTVQRVLPGLSAAVAR